MASMSRQLRDWAPPARDIRPHALLSATGVALTPILAVMETCPLRCGGR